MSLIRADIAKHPHRHCSPLQGPSSSICPSQDQIKIQCPCHLGSVSARLQFYEGPNLAIVLSQCMGQWINEMKLNLDFTSKSFNWQYRVKFQNGYRYPPNTEFITEDRDRIIAKKDDEGILSPPKNSNSWILITTPQCYEKIVKVCSTSIFKKGRGKNQNTVTTQALPIVWGRVARDEAHREHGAGTTTVRIFRGLGSKTSRWMITGTPFESTPAHLQYWAEGVEKNWKAYPPLTQLSPWLREARTKLKNTASSQFIQLGKDYNTLIRSKDVISKEAAEAFGQKLQPMLSTFWLQRKFPGSLWFGKQLIALPTNRVRQFNLRVSDKQRQTIDSAITELKRKWQNDFEQRLAAWRRNPRGAIPVISIMSYLSAVYSMRIFATCPGLQAVAQDLDLKLTIKGMTEGGGNWLQREPGQLYQLARNDLNPYQRRIRQITALSPKIAAINIIRGRHEIGVNGNAMVLCCISTTDAAILYWV